MTVERGGKEESLGALEISFKVLCPFYILKKLFNETILLFLKQL